MGRTKITAKYELPFLFCRLKRSPKVKLLDDNVTYLGNQLESEFGGDRCFGILANMDFIMVCTYEAEGANPELVLYKKR